MLKERWLSNEISKLKNSGLSKADIASKLDAKPQYINNIIHGGRGITDTFLDKFIETFKINHFELARSHRTDVDISGTPYYDVDFCGGFDLEWNSKDQTFDRDLLAMRTYFDCGLIDVGIIVTRSAELNDVFRDLGIMAKYGASTTWIGKLTYRLDSRRNGGCPILAVGIKRECVAGYE